MSDFLCLSLVTQKKNPRVGGAEPRAPHPGRPPKGPLFPPPASAASPSRGTPPQRIRWASPTEGDPARPRREGAAAPAGRNPRRGAGFRAGGVAAAGPRHGGGGRGSAGLFRGLRQLQLRLGARRTPTRPAPGGGRRGGGGQPETAAAVAAARRALP